METETLTYTTPWKPSLTCNPYRYDTLIAILAKPLRTSEPPACKDAEADLSTFSLRSHMKANGVWQIGKALHRSKYLTDLTFAILEEFT